MGRVGALPRHTAVPGGHGAITDPGSRDGSHQERTRHTSLDRRYWVLRTDHRCARLLPCLTQTPLHSPMPLTGITPSGRTTSPSTVIDVNMKQITIAASSVVTILAAMLLGRSVASPHPTTPPPQCGVFDQGNHVVDHLGPFYGMAPGCMDLSEDQAIALALADALEAIQAWMGQQQIPQVDCPQEAGLPASGVRGVRFIIQDQLERIYYCWHPLSALSNYRRFHVSHCDRERWCLD